MFIVVVTKKAQKEYDRLSEKDQVRVFAAMQNLGLHPFTGKKLDAEHDGYWSVRVWPYRIIYTIHKKIITVTVVAIGDRKDVYRRLR